MSCEVRGSCPAAFARPESEKMRILGAASIAAFVGSIYLSVLLPFFALVRLWFNRTDVLGWAILGLLILLAGIPLFTSWWTRAFIRSAPL